MNVLHRSLLWGADSRVRIPSRVGFQSVQHSATAVCLATAGHDCSIHVLHSFPPSFSPAGDASASSPIAIPRRATEPSIAGSPTGDISHDSPLIKGMFMPHAQFACSLSSVRILRLRAPEQDGKMACEVNVESRCRRRHTNRKTNTCPLLLSPSAGLDDYGGSPLAMSPQTLAKTRMRQFGAQVAHSRYGGGPLRLLILA